MTDIQPVYFKAMLENGLTRYERPGWYLPKGSRPGKWMPKIATLELCASGYHVCTVDQLREWIAPAIYVVEVRVEHVEDRSKSAWQQARLVRRVEGWGMDQMVEWAKRCAGHVAHLRNATYAVNAVTYAAYATYAAASNAAKAAATTSAEKQWQTDLLKTMLNLTESDTE